jgi:hypothetical protein
LIPPNFLAIFFQKRLKISCADESFDVFIPSFHHSVVDIANPDMVRKYECETNDTHNNIGVCEAYQ